MPSNDLMTDPVCGMRIAPSRAAGSREHRGVTHYFCSPFCIRKFDEDADAYIAAARIREAEGGGGAAFGWDEHYDMS
jgi:Cu+-exporting ATPase